MSLITDLNMSCTISRNSGNPTARKDSHGYMSVSWAQIAAGVKCFIYQFQLSAAQFNQQVIGQQQVNRFVAIFKPGQDVLAGDKIECSSFPQKFLVDSAVPFVHPVKNTVHHIECMLSVMV